MREPHEHAFPAVTLRLPLRPLRLLLNSFTAKNAKVDAKAAKQTVPGPTRHRRSFHPYLAGILTRRSAPTQYERNNPRDTNLPIEVDDSCASAGRDRARQRRLRKTEK